MNYLRKLLLLVKGELDGEGDVAYLKAGVLGTKVGMGPREAAHRFRYMRESDTVPVTVEHWSKTARSTTYRVTVDDWGAFTSYLRSLRGEEEPVLNAA